jgi:hypothetical protein
MLEAPLFAQRFNTTLTCLMETRCLGLMLTDPRMFWETAL